MTGLARKVCVACREVSAMSTTVGIVATFAPAAVAFGA